MNYAIISILVVLCILGVALLVILLKKKGSQGVDTKFNREMNDKYLEISIRLKELREGNQDFLALLEKSISGELQRGSLVTNEALERLKESLILIDKNVSDNLKELKDNNEKQLEKMRLTVDDKLQKTLDEKLKLNFESVDKSIKDVIGKMGELSNLTHGIGDLQRTLSGIQSRGAWGEMQLENLIKNILDASQYEFQSNLGVIKNKADRVDAAILMRNREKGTVQYVPIDAKFPVASFLEMSEASTEADKELYEKLQKEMKSTIKKMAQDIAKKYIIPPNTTDFAFLFLPTESLYAEVLKIKGLYEDIQHTYKVLIVGPVTLTPMLYALYEAYRNYEIQSKGEEVIDLLKAVRASISVFSESLVKSLKQITNAQTTIEKTIGETKKIEKELTLLDNLTNDNSINLLED